MKTFFSILCQLMFTICLSAQNVGIGTNTPASKLHVKGNLLVTAALIAPVKTPTAGQIKTMINGDNTIYDVADSTGRFYDPGGPAGNYGANLNAGISVPGVINGALEFTIESIQLGTGDSLLILDYNNTSNRLLALGNGNSTTGTYIFNGISIAFIFTSNGDASVGSGFAIFFKRLFPDAGAPEVGNTAGLSMFFDTRTGAFRSGYNTDAPRGDFSFGAGYFSEASGDYSLAIGNSAVASNSGGIALGTSALASGNNSVAIGQNSKASDNHSIAIGQNTIASSQGATAIGTSTKAYGFATAFGVNTLAGGQGSTAMGSGTVSDGSYSTAMGWFTISHGYAGTALGMYNDPILGSGQSVGPTSATPLLIVGNGDDANARSNALVVRKNGDLLLNAAQNVEVHMQAAGVEKAFVQMNGDELRVGTYSSNAAGRFVVRTNGADRIVVDGNNLTPALRVNGNICYTGSIAACSDIRYKKNITPVSNALSSVLSLHGIYYNWKKEEYANRGFGDDRQIGFSAQEIQKLFPEMVQTDKDGYMAVDYSRLTPVLVEAIKEQQKQIDELKALLLQTKN